MRIVKGTRPRGSQHWLQLLANSKPQEFESALASPYLGSVAWKSPVAGDEYAEYQDLSFLELLGLSLGKVPLNSYWPRRGPVWDGLATTSTGAVLLVEAKANIPELKSPPSQASPRSAALIQSSLESAKSSFGARSDASWADTFYQYANRLAHLHLLRAENEIDAYLVFLYFVNASDVDGPESEEEWQPAIHEAHQALGISQGPLTPYVLEVFVDVNSIENRSGMLRH